MRKLNLISAFILALLLPAISSAQEREKVLSPHIFSTDKGDSLPYRLFVPQNYDPKQKYPLVVYLHGGGGVGDDNLKQINGGNGYLIDFFTQTASQTRYPALVVAPQSSGDGWVQTPLTHPTATQLRMVRERRGSAGRPVQTNCSRYQKGGRHREIH